MDWILLLYRLAAVAVGAGFILVDPGASFSATGHAGVSRIPSLTILFLYVFTGSVAALRTRVTVLRRPLRDVVLTLELVLAGILSRVTSQEDSIFHLYFPLVLGWSTKGLTLRQGFIAGAFAAAISITVGSSYTDRSATIYSAFLLPLFGAVSAGQQTGGFAETVGQLQRALEARTRLRDLERTRSTVKAMAPLSLKARLGRLLDEAMSLVAGDIALAALIDDEGALRVMDVRNLDVEDWQNRQLPSQEGLVARILTDGAATLTADAARDPAWQAVLGGVAVRAAVAVPIRVQARVIGVAVFARRQGREFRPVDVQSLTLLVDETAVALHDAHVQQKLHHLLTGSVRVLTSAMESRDPTTQGHSQRVAALAVALATELGLPAQEVEHVRLAALLHNIGKIGTPEGLLHREPQSLDEQLAKERYPVRGAAMLAALPPLRPLANLVLYHQESFDGSGYPKGLAGDEIPLGARIIRVADTFDALLSDRTHGHTVTVSEAAAQLRWMAGTVLDPHVVETALRVLSTTPYLDAELALGERIRPGRGLGINA